MTATANPTMEAPTARTAAALGWTSAVIGMTTAVLLLFNAESLRSWADEMTPTETSLAIRQAADGWADTMQGLGFSGPRDAVHGLWKAAQGANFGG